MDDDFETLSLKERESNLTKNLIEGDPLVKAKGLFLQNLKQK